MSIEEFATEKELGQCMGYVEEFMTSFNMPSNDVTLWENLIEEEISEFIAEDESSEESLKELCDVVYVHCGLLHSLEVPMDYKYNLYESSVIEFINSQFFSMEAFRRVHESNMSKLDDEGKPIYNEDGKVMKGQNYKPPYLGDLV